MRRAGADIKALRIPRTVLEPVRQVLERHAVEVSFADMLAQLGVTREQFEDPAFSIDGEQLSLLFGWVQGHARGKISMRDWLSHFSATSAGLAGMAALSARNVRESLLVAVRYLPLLMPVMRADLVEAPPKVLFTLEMTADMGEMNSYLLEMVTAAVHVISNDVMSEVVPRVIHFRHGYGEGSAASAHRRDLENIFSAPIVFNSHFDGMEGRLADMEVATRSPNEATFNTVKRILEDEISTRQGIPPFSATVHQELVRMANAGQFPSLEEFSAHMNLSPRTLIRRLSSEQTSFKSIANEVWFRLAKELLMQTRFSVKQIAARTGFNNTNSFSRAFKSLSGETPLAWRSRKLP